MALSIEISLLSGRTVTLETSADETVDSLQRRAGEALGTKIRCLITQDHVALKTPSDRVQDFGRLTALVGSRGPNLCPGRYSFAALRGDGSVVAWGDPLRGGDCSAVRARLSSGVVGLHCSRGSAYAALLQDGGVVTWGSSSFGGDCSGVEPRLQQVQEITATEGAFAALLPGGAVVTWGHRDYGGDSRAVQDELAAGVSRVLAGRRIFLASKEDGSVVTWGDPSKGGDSSGVREALMGGVERLFCTSSACAALKPDGSVVTWGAAGWGGSCEEVREQLAVGVRDVHGNDGAFAAVLQDGSVVPWGHPECGGNPEGLRETLASLSGPLDVCSSARAFAVLVKNEGRVLAWGSHDCGGRPTPLALARLSSGVAELAATSWAFAVRKEDGEATEIFSWGRREYGGGFDLPAVAAQPQPKSQPQRSAVKIFASDGAFCALREDGSVTTWGHRNFGGFSSGLVHDRLARGRVEDICAAPSVFAAIMRDGSVIVWGNQEHGACQDDVPAVLE